MSTVLLMLAMHQDIQEKVIQEFNSVFNTADDEIDNIDFKKLEYFDLVIKETMRLFPIAPIIGRMMTADMKLDGKRKCLLCCMKQYTTFFVLDTYTLPKGANVIIRLIDIQRNPRFWGDDAAAFKPERFLSENIKKVHPYAFIPFSAGARICIGHKYATNVMKIVLCHILRKFKVSTPLKYDELKLEISFVVRIAQNYMIKLEPRNAQI